MVLEVAQSGRDLLSEVTQMRVGDALIGIISYNAVFCQRVNLQQQWV